jgi:hypothetical protein
MRTPNPHFAYQNGGLYEVLLAALIFAIVWPLRHRLRRTGAFVSVDQHRTARRRARRVVADDRQIAWASGAGRRVGEAIQAYVCGA